MHVIVNMESNNIKPVRYRKPEKSNVVTIRLTKEQYKEIRYMAKQKKIGIATEIRWRLFGEK